MICERCQERQATIHITKLEDGKQTHINLCEPCAIREGILHPFQPTILNQKPQVEENCPCCGLSEMEWKTGGFLGCSHCYHAFRNALKPILMGLHGATQHKTAERRAPEPIPEEEALLRLRTELAEAIGEERYEEAARIRDAIRALTREGAEEGTGRGSK